MKEHQQSGKVNCPKCGAKWSTMTGGKTKFHCGSIAADEGDVCPQSELCKDIEHDKKQLELLRSKLTPEGAKPLKWEYDFPTRTHTAEGAGGRILGIVHRDGIDLWCDDEVAMENFITIDAAKAHAEELHQQAFREFVEKWGRK